MKRVLCILALAILVPACAQAFTLVDNSTGPRFVICPCCYVRLNPQNVAYLPAGGAAAMGQRATLLQDFPGVNVAIGGAAPGTLTVDRYFARCYGAHLTCRYDDGDGIDDWSLPIFGNSVSYRWMQEINTNKPLGGTTQPYIDPRPNDDKGVKLPYYWTDPEAIFRYSNGGAGGGQYDLIFRDSPSRECTQYVWWRGDLFVTSENRFTNPQTDPLHVITICDGISWGFELFPTFAKLISIYMYDFIFFSLTPRTVSWSPGIAQSQVYGTADVLVLHAEGATTHLPGESFADNKQRHETHHGEFHVPSSYLFSATIDELKRTDVVINGLDLDTHTEVAVPIVEKPGVQEISMTINLDDDLLVVLDDSLQVQRYDTALYVGSFSVFAGTPEEFGFVLLGTRTVKLDTEFRETHYSIAEAKMLSDGAAVTVIEKTASTDFHYPVNSSFYIEEPTRIAGIRTVPNPEEPAVIFPRGAVVRVDGLMATTDDGERFIDRARIALGPISEPVRPVGLTNRSIGGGDFGKPADGTGQQGPTGGVGLNNVGLLIRTWGRIVEREPGLLPSWFVIDDGSGANVKCLVPEGVPVDPSLLYVAVTGISSIQKDGSNLRRVVSIRDAQDIKPYWP